MKFPYFTKEDLIDRAKELKRSHFRPGYDNMTAQSAELWLMVNGDRLLSQLARGTYAHAPVVGFHVAKKSGKFRTLVKTTAIDTVIQQCFLTYLQSEYDPLFSSHTYAYRPGQGVTAALQEYCRLGSVYRWAAKIDPIDCFGSMDFNVLQEALTAFLKKKPVINLLMAYAQTPILEEGELRNREKGIPQGIPVGPFLCNVYLNQIVRHLEESEIPFIRYADDIVLFGNDLNSLKEQMSALIQLMDDALHVKPNLKKCKIDSALNLSYLGHRFFSTSEGMISIEPEESAPAACHAWRSEQIKNNGHTVNLLSDGILRQRDFSLLLDTDKGAEHIPINNTECINVFSNVVFDSDFLKSAAEHGIVVNVFSSHGKLVGRFLPQMSLRAPLVTLSQLQVYYDADYRLDLARKFVLGSLHNLRLNIRYYRRQNNQPVYTSSLEEIDGLERQIKEVNSYENLLLLEARVRASYYRCYDSFAGNSGFVFYARSRRPPQNPINAMLSFGNTVLYSYIATEICKTALDVRVGFLHATNSRMESLNLDVAELFRPLLVDRVIFSLINRRQLDERKHFTIFENGAVYLNAEGKRIFLEAFTGKMYSRLKVGGVSMTYAEIIREEVRKLVRLFRVGEPYKPFKQVR